jgi:glycine dehydrogenase subunit 1
VTYLFNTPDQQRDMLEVIGVDSIDELFNGQIPSELQLDRPLDLPAPLTEIELESVVGHLASRNCGVGSQTCFMGGGAYDHFVPAAVDEVVSRGEFYTAYTPYQAEASQGSLQAFFEFQSLICQLTGMDVSNASLYEGGTAVSEAAFMAMRITNRHKRVVVLESVHPEYRSVLKTYLHNLGCELVSVPTPDGTVDVDAVRGALDDKTACLIVQHPNFYGCLEDAKHLTETAHNCGALSVVSFDPLSLGILNRPGSFGADIAVAEGQSLGIPLQYGGPYLGLLACRNKFVRKMPGRLIGQAKDRRGNDCYILNLQAREQHIRREKATSNICTNQGLLALRATVYLSLLGPKGVEEAATLCCHKAHYAAQKMAEIDGVELLFDRPFFKEFAIRVKGGADQLIAKVADRGMGIGPSFAAAGIDGHSDQLLVAVTEKRSREEIDLLVEIIADCL